MAALITGVDLIKATLDISKAYESVCRTTLMNKLGDILTIEGKMEMATSHR